MRIPSSDQIILCLVLEIRGAVTFDEEGGEYEMGGKDTDDRIASCVESIN